MQPTVQQLMNGELDGSLEGFVFDPAVCRRAFDHYDKDKSGFLDTKEMMKLAEVFSTYAVHVKLMAGFNFQETVSRSSGTRFSRRGRSFPRQTKRFQQDRINYLNYFLSDC